MNELTVHPNVYATGRSKVGHADTVRINARPKTAQAQGTQYFWLSRDCYDFFPPLTTLNRRGHKKTYSCLIEMDFVAFITSSLRAIDEAIFIC